MDRLQYNGRNHYSACVLDRGKEKSIRDQNYKLVKVPGNGDCFYNALLKSMSSFGDVGMTGSDLRNLVNTKLTDQDIADVAIPLITDYAPTKLGLGANFMALMQSGRTQHR
ncbi:hypothetical protein [Coleofasciculus sp. FACHB-129]|uniref:hypothetical protein n=1 Tax=Cyanophyceae TaxID=3028117 RepID=UPI001684A9E0|nr:hypothetical protein [Coleofasciculus sp. FACHB-129]MBD1897943.1 hypothetical protein [Coleofasciculus sp. FACHB-129]